MRVVSSETLGRVLASLPGVPRVVASGNAAAPLHLLGAVDAALPSYRLFMLNAPDGIPAREGVIHETCFVGPGMRGRKGLSYFPARLSLVPRLFTGSLAPDVVVLNVSPPRSGVVSLGIEVNVMPAAIEAARSRGALVVAQINEQMPCTHGDATVPVAEVDLAVEADEAPLVVTAHEPDKAALAVGERVAELVPRGATLQAGIGAVPDAVLFGLLENRNLRIWSEMFSDGVMALDQAGALDQQKPITASFCLGSPELYEWLDRNPRVRMLRTEKTNDPALISRHAHMVSVNTALQVDLFGQANASRVEGRIYSGFGGQTDFVVGALHAAGGQAIMALRSWHPKADCSTIIPLVDEPVTSFQHSAVITEQGVAPIWGFDQNTQARHLIQNAAHPDARDELWEEAAELGLT